MARTPRDTEHIVAARRLIKTARTADDIRIAQAVLLPLDLGLSIAQTARIIGRSVGATSTLRNRFIDDLARTALEQATDAIAANEDLPTQDAQRRAFGGDLR